MVIPARDEAARLTPTLGALSRWVATCGRRVEVIVADDGSTDGTGELALFAAPKLRVRVLRLPPRGAGAAMRAGVAAAHGERILLSDADGAVPFDEIDGLWRALDARADIAVGSRALKPTPRRWHRRLLARGWSFTVRSLTGLPVKDSQCGFKLFDGAVARRIFAATRSDGFALHAEVLLVAHHLGLHMVELPVGWREMPGSKVRVLHDALRMTWELWRAQRRRRCPALNLPLSPRRA